MTDVNTEDVWDNKYLFTSTTDHPNEETIHFEGKIPDWLKGTLYRNGPGGFEVNDDPKTTFHHAFDGFAFIHKYNIDGESQVVRFRGSFIKSHTYTESRKIGNLAVQQFGTDPCKSIFGRFQSLFRSTSTMKITDDTGVTVQMVNNQLLALTELPNGNILDSDTLELVGPLRTLPYGKRIDSELFTLTTAHVMYDAKRKMTVGYGERVSPREYWLDVIFISDRPESQEKKDDNEEDKSIIEDERFIHLTRNMNDRAKDYNRCIKSNTKLFRFPLENASYMHSATITEDYLILSEIPFHFNTFYAIKKVLSGGAATHMFKWKGPSSPTYFRVISLDTGEQIAHIPGPAFFAFHHINSYQDKDNPKKLIIDICAYDDPSIIDDLYLEKLRTNAICTGGGYLRRFVLDLDTKTCTEPFPNTRESQERASNGDKNSLVPVAFELPRISPQYFAKYYRYAYGIRILKDRMFDALVKLDVESKEQVALWEQPCTSPSEPIFVPRPGAENTREDDGVVLSVILEQKTKRSYLLVLDGITFKELGRAYLPIHIPLSFHGNFY